MAAQKTYGYDIPRGVAGGLYDLSPYSIDSRVNGEASAETLKFGMGVVQGTTPGSNVKRPVPESTGEEFEGLLLTGYTNEMDMLGDVKIHHLQTVGILRYGKAWARVADGLTINYGDPLYLIIDGEDTGLFSNADTDAIAVNGRFIGSTDSSNIAPVEIFNAPAPAAA